MHLSIFHPVFQNFDNLVYVCLKNINITISIKPSVNQWRETGTVIKFWFKNIGNKSNCIFIQPDIEEFQSFISKGLLMKAINHAKSFVAIRKVEVNNITHSPKSLLFSNTFVWIKREDDPNFDVTTGSFDEMEK